MTTLHTRQKVEGFYTLKVRDAATGKVKREVGPFKNKITDIGLNRFGSAFPMLYAYVGTGTTPAAFSDTSMGTFKVASASTGPADDTKTAATLSNPYCSTSYVRRFAARAINGNITEVGVGWTNNSVNGLWSRELIVDSGGNPITLTVLANEFLDIVYTIRYYISITDTLGSFVLNGITYNYTLRTSFLGSATVNLTASAGAPVTNLFYRAGSTLGPVTGGPSGTTVGAAVSTTFKSYVSNSYTAECINDIPLAGGNAAGGITIIFLTASVSGGVTGLSQTWQMLLDKPIPKTNANSMSFTFARTWARV